MMYRCYDTFLSPFKVKCNCGKEFEKFSELKRHIKETTGQIVPDIAAPYFKKGGYYGS